MRTDGVNLDELVLAADDDSKRIGKRLGFNIEKGILLTEERCIENEELYKHWMDFFVSYPDLFLDFIKPADSNFELFFYQRIFLRVCMRYREVYVCAPRAFSKTFISILAMMLLGSFRPKSKFFICAPRINQSVKIATEKIREIWDFFPFLKKEIIGEGNFGKDYIKLTYRNGSIFDVVGATDSTRGGRRAFGLIDEIRDHSETELNEIVLPLLNVSRRTCAGLLNPNEPHQQRIFAA